MQKLIDANELLNKLDDELYTEEDIKDSFGNNDADWMKGYNKAIIRTMSKIENAPEAYVVKYAHWIPIEGKYGGAYGVKCSNCGGRARQSDQRTHKYCAFCGYRIGKNDDTE